MTAMRWMGTTILAMGCATAPVQPARQATMQMQIDVKGEGRPLVLVGGGLTGWQSWIPFQERLSPTRRVGRAQPLAVQFGLEQRALPAGYSVNMEADALAAGLDAAGLSGPIDVVAWSYGAAITLDFALDHPERVRTLTLIEPPAFWVLEATGSYDPQSLRESEEMRALHTEFAGDVTEEQLARFAAMAGLLPPGKAAHDLPMWPNWVKHRRSLLTGTAAWDHRDTAARLKAFDRPALLVKGSGSSHFLHRVIDALVAAMPDARVIELPGGHAPQLVAMDEFLRALGDFHREARAPR